MEDRRGSGEVRDTCAGLGQSRGSLRGPLILARLIVDALDGASRGDRSSYSAICEQLSQRDMKPVVIKKWLQALQLCVSKLTKDYDVLVGAMLRLPWFSQDDDIISLYIEFLTSLVSAQTYYLQSVLISLSGHLVNPTINDQLAYQNIHDAIRCLLELVPTAPSVLMPLLMKGFPFRLKGAEFQEVAVRNVLHVTSYCPTLFHDILQLLVHQMLSVDVEVPCIEEEEGEREGDVVMSEEVGEEAEGSLEEMQFHVELDSCHSPTHPPSSSPSPHLCPVLSKLLCMKHPSADKLDIMMTVLFPFLHSVCHQNGTLLLSQAVQLFQSLLKIFEQVILPTHACSHVQYLLYKTTSYHDTFPGYFLDFLWEKFQDLNTPAVIRQTAAAYMASFIARARFVSVNTAKLCLTIMMQWTHHYIDGCGYDQLHLDPRQHGPFYSLCQAVFYIFVFRHRAFVNMEGGVGFLRQLNFERLISCRLNPLKVALPSVVEKFASLTSHHEIVFCYTILEQNKRLILSSSSSSSSSSSQNGANQIEYFFPFDPYRLKRSSKFIHPFYHEWEELDEDKDEREKTHEGEASREFSDDLPPFPSSLDSLSHHPFSSSLESSLSPR